MYPYESSPPLLGPASPRSYLKYYGFQQRWRARPWFPWAVALLVVVIAALLLFPGTKNPPGSEGIRAVVFTATGFQVAELQTPDPGIASVLSPGGSGIKATDLIGPFVTLLLLLYGLQQWQGGRREVSIDKYYERLETANQRWEKSAEVKRLMGSPMANAGDEMFMYVCTELDNLEYVVEKYRFGYIDDAQACRGLKTFQLRCFTPKFREIARDRVHDGDYTSRTANVVCRVCEALDELAEHEAAVSRALRRTAREQEGYLERNEKGTQNALPAKTFRVAWAELPKNE